MSGHSKWANIKHRKTKMDEQKGKVFTKIARELAAAARHGGSDPEGNPRLKFIMQKARSVNMPNDNIQRAIKKGSGDLDGVHYEEAVYEGYGPGGVAIMMDILTDNRNRTAGEVRYIFSRNGGSLGESGCVAWMFEHKGVLTLELAEQKLTEDDIALLAIEAGADDISSEEGLMEIITSTEAFMEVMSALEKDEVKFTNAELTRLASNEVEISDPEQAAQIVRLIDALEDHDDVQNVFSNADIADEAMAVL